MPSPDSSWELQEAIYTALTGDAPLMAMISGVHDHVPQDTAFPYITIGASTAREWGAAAVDGVESTLILHVWSRSRGRKEVKQITAEIHRVLHDADLTVTGHGLIWLRFEQSRSLLDADGATYHGIVRFRALTNAA